MSFLSKSDDDLIDYHASRATDLEKTVADLKEQLAQAWQCAAPGTIASCNRLVEQYQENESKAKAFADKMRAERDTYRATALARETEIDTLRAARQQDLEAAATRAANAMEDLDEDLVERVCKAIAKPPPVLRSCGCPINSYHRSPCVLR